MEQRIVDRITARMEECRGVIKTAYGVDIGLPRVTFNLSGTAAGRAYGKENRVDFNAALLIKHEDEFINRTVVHEYAHIAQYRLYPDTLIVSADDRKAGRRRDIHGVEWQRLMRLFGADTSRCHSYDVSEVSPRQKYEIFCTSCEKEYALNQRKTPSLARYKCKCGEVGTLAFKPHTTSSTVSVNHTATTKIGQCEAIYLTYNYLGRQRVLDLFEDQVGISRAHAATYYATCKKRLG